MESKKIWSGVARISDLTILWILFGLFAALINLDDGNQETADLVVPQSPQRIGRRQRRITARTSTARSFSAGLMIRLALVAWLAGGIGVITWQKSINNVRASVAEGRALQDFQDGDLEGSMLELDKAIKLAPGIPNYYNNRAQVFLAYQLRPEAFTEPGCDQQTEAPYVVCLGIQSLESNLESVNRQKFNFRSWLAAGNSAFNLRLNGISLESYTNAAGMVPGAWDINNDLAESQIDVSLYDEAIGQLNLSLEITGDSRMSARALYLKGRATKELGRPDDAVVLLKRGITLEPGSPSAQPSLDLIREIYTEQRVRRNTDYFDLQISQDSQDAVAYYFRGMAHLALGDTEIAVLDIQESYQLGFRLSEVRANLGHALLKTGGGNVGKFVNVAREEPGNALFNAYFGEYRALQGNYVGALNYLDKANVINPDLGLSYLIRSKVFVLLGFRESAREALSTSAKLSLPTAPDYIDRGEIYAFLGNYDLAFLDVDQAIEINPDQARFYHARGKTHANMGDFDSALADLNIAIEKDSGVGEFFITRGVVYDILGNTDLSMADFESGRSLSVTAIPSPADRNASYFAAYIDTTSTEFEAIVLLHLRTISEAQLDIDNNIGARPDDENYTLALQVLAESYLNLENWTQAAEVLSELIEISPETPELYRFRGDSYLALKRYLEAAEDHFQGVVLGAFDSNNFIARGRGYAATGDYERAREDFTAAIRLDPESSDAYADRGYISVQTGDYSAALPDLDRAIQLSPINHDAFVKKAEAYIGLSQRSDALDNLDQAVTLSPTNSDFLYTRATLHIAMSETNLALQDLNLAIALNDPEFIANPNHAEPVVDRGRLHFDDGKIGAAEDDANKAIALLVGIQDSPVWENYLPEINGSLADAFELLGDVYTELGQPLDAQAEYLNASERR